MTRQSRVYSVLLLALICPGAHADSAGEAQAVKTIEKLGGRVARDDKAAGKPVRSVHFFKAKVGVADLKVLAAFEQLQAVDLVDCPQMTNAGLKELAAAKRLQRLSLAGTKVTDACFKELAACQQLQVLSLSRTQVTGAGVKELAACKHLQELHLQGTGMTDAGVKELAVLKQLRSISLSGCKQVTDAGVQELVGLPDLQTLNLSFTQVTDAVVKMLAACKQLRDLDLWSCNLVTDASVRALAACKQLRRLTVYDCPKVTYAGVADLKDVLPGLEVSPRFRWKPSFGPAMPKGLVGRWKGPPIILVGLLFGTPAERKEAKGNLLFEIRLLKGGDVFLMQGYTVVLKDGSASMGGSRSFALREKDKKLYLVLERFDQAGDLRLEMEVSGDTLKLKAPRKVSMYNVKGPVDFTGEWKRIVEKKATPAPRRHPAEDKGVKSTNGAVPSSIKFVNKSGQTIKVFWLDYEGKRKHLKTVYAGESFQVEKAALTHPFLVTDKDDNAWSVYFADSEPRQVEIVAPKKR